MKYALIIGIEDYKLGINKVHYASNDANAFKKAMLLNGCEDSNIHILVNEDATTSSILSTLHKLSYEIKENDELIFFFAGHGEIVKGRQYLITYDTSYSNIPSTAIPLDELFSNIRNFKRVTIFLDSCHSGMQLNALQRGGEILEKDPFELLKGLEYQVAFASCKNGEKSYGSDKLQHGTWTYHVIQALTGAAPSSIYKPNGGLPSSSLQEYLNEYVPSFVRQEHGDEKVQTPWFFGGYTRDFSVRQAQTSPANLQSKEKTLPKATPPTITEDSTVKPRTIQIDVERQIEYFYKVETGWIRDLSGFKKGSHTEPKYLSKATRDFVIDKAKDDIKEEVNFYLDQIQRSKLFKDSQIVVEYDEWGCIDCNEVFYIQVSVKQDDENWKKYIMKTELIIHSGMAGEFFKILPNLSLRTFERIVYKLPYKINISNTLSILEHEVEDNVLYDYTPGEDYININLDDETGTIILREGSDSIEFYSRNSSLIEVFDDLKDFLDSIENEQIKSLVIGLARENNRK
ncbi:caspase domain-containing protein [Peribacillus sp. Hz7]|uniref:caspase family protein n=1 Tax=Peribacillus sp. Hz7 TaxID=3344873 RepID=UPI0035CA5185